MGRLLRSKKINFLNLGERISKIAKKYKSIKTKDILLIRLSNLFITRILNIFLGFINFPLRKTFFINNIAILPWQLLYFYFATKVDFLSEILINYGVDLSIVRFLSIISITSIIFLIVRIFVKLFKKFNLINFIENFIKWILFLKHLKHSFANWHLAKVTPYCINVNVWTFKSHTNTAICESYSSLSEESARRSKNLVLSNPLLLNYFHLLGFKWYVKPVC